MGVIYVAIRLYGNWDKGYALSEHSKSSTFIGYTPSGRAEFETDRTEMGALIHGLKYRKNYGLVTSIIDLIRRDFKSLGVIDLIVPVPPSTEREIQPVHLICRVLGTEYKVPVENNWVFKTGKTTEQKNLSNRTEKVEVAKGSFSLNPGLCYRNRNVLLVDDIYDSGATLEAITEILKSEGKVKRVCVLTMTKTK